MQGRRPSRGLILAALALAVTLLEGAGSAATRAVPADSAAISISYSGSFVMTNTAVPQKTPSSSVFRVEWQYAWSGTWGGLFRDKNVFSSGARPFPRFTITGRIDVKYKERSDGPSVSCTLQIVGDKASPPSFIASYDPSGGTLMLQVQAPTNRESDVQKPRDPLCVGGPGVNVFGAPANFSPLGGGGGTVDIEKGGSIRWDRDWKWTHVFPGDLDRARRDYKAAFRSTLTVAGDSCRGTAAACGPRVSSLTYANRLWDATGGGVPFSNGAALVADRRDRPPLRVEAAAPVGCSDDRLAVWLDCDADGTQEKSWPVAFVRGTTPPVAEVRFRQQRSCRKLGALTVIGRSTLPNGSTLTFERTGVKPKGCAEIRVRGLTAEGTLPNDVRAWRLRIEWTLVERNGTRHPAGTTDTPAYTLLGAPTTYVDRPLPGIQDTRTSRPFLSLVDLVATEAEGVETAADLVDRTFRAFRLLNVRPRTLVVAKGDVRRDAPMFYWARNDPWTIEKFVNAQYKAPTPASCPDGQTQLLLTQGVSTGGRCGSWGPLFASLLALQGIRAVSEGLPGEGAAWTAVVPPRVRGCEGARPDDCWMLIKPWRFAREAKPPYRYRLDVKGDQPRPLDRTVWYDLPKAGRYSGQGPQPAPPGLFRRGDHAIVRVGDRIYDPSYGTEFGSVAEWARGSLAGWGTVRCARRERICTLEAWPLAP